MMLPTPFHLGLMSLGILSPLPSLILISPSFPIFQNVVFLISTPPTITEVKNYIKTTLFLFPSWLLPSASTLWISVAFYLWNTLTTLSGHCITQTFLIIHNILKAEFISLHADLSPPTCLSSFIFQPNEWPSVQQGSFHLFFFHRLESHWLFSFFSNVIASDRMIFDEIVPILFSRTSRKLRCMEPIEQQWAFRVDLSSLAENIHWVLTLCSSSNQERYGPCWVGVY